MKGWTSCEPMCTNMQVLWASRCPASCCSALEAQQCLQAGGMHLVWQLSCALAGPQYSSDMHRGVGSLERQTNLHDTQQCVQTIH
jgi:hypothetical protein